MKNRNAEHADFTDVRGFLSDLTTFKKLSNLQLFYMYFEIGLSNKLIYLKIFYSFKLETSVI